MYQAAAGSVGQRCQLEGEISMQNIDLGKEMVIDPVNGRQRCQVPGEIVINIENPDEEGDPEEEGDHEEEEPDELPRCHLEIYQAAFKGDWEVAKEKYRMGKVDFGAPITTRGETALHIATLAERFDFVRQLVNVLSADELCYCDIDGNTALTFAVCTGKVELAEVMLMMNRDLVMQRDKDHKLPLHVAALLGHKNMVSCLYALTKCQLEAYDRMDLFVALIHGDMYDVALDLLQTSQEKLGIGKDSNEETALDALARKSHFLSNASAQVQRRGLDITVSGSDRIQRSPHDCAHELLVRICEQVTTLTGKEISKLIGKYWKPIFVAVEQGNVEFLRILIRNFPDVLFKTNQDGLTIFHVAIMNRRERIFSMIYEIGSFKNVIARYRDKNDNNMLHLAGMLAPPERLNVLPGEALQLRQELLWFEEVKKLVGPRLANAKNKLNQTPSQVFMINHAELAAAGARSMRDTANSCIVVATLVATVAFAAAFTVPGGNDQNTGFPMFLQKTLFKIFVVSDAISLVFSVSSVLTFLSLFTSSTYTLNDFLRTLPAKLQLGLSTLFISIIAMMVAFVTAFFIYFKQEPLRYALPVAVVAFAPICLFFWFHYRLFVDIIKSTYPIFHPGSGDSLFQTAEIKPKKKTS